MRFNGLLSLACIKVVFLCDGNHIIDNQLADTSRWCDEVSHDSCSAQGTSMLQKAPHRVSLISDGFRAAGQASRDVTEEEWKKVVGECSLASTDMFIRAFLTELNHQICDEGCHNGIIPFWDCNQDLTFGSLQAQILENARSTCPCYGPGTLGECQPFPEQCLESNPGELDQYWHRRRTYSKTLVQNADPNVTKVFVTNMTTTTTTIQEVVCTAGFYHTSPAAACIECSGYTRRRRAESCTDCNAHHCHRGHKKKCNEKLLYPVSNQDSCSPEVVCNGGYYHKSGLAPCIECAGSARRRRSTSCTKCETGKHNAIDQDDCDKDLECHAGYFLSFLSFLQEEQNVPRVCAECKGSTRRRRASSCTSCPAGRYSLPHKDNCGAEVICESGYYHDSPEKKCIECMGSTRRRRAASCTDCGTRELHVVDEDNCELEANASLSVSFPL